MLLDPRSHFKQILFLAAHSWSCTCCVESKLSRDAVKSAIDSLSYGIGRDIGRSSSICPCLWESVYLSDLNICYGCISILKAKHYTQLFYIATKNIWWIWLSTVKSKICERTVFYDLWVRLHLWVVAFKGKSTLFSEIKNANKNTSHKFSNSCTRLLLILYHYITRFLLVEIFGSTLKFQKRDVSEFGEKQKRINIFLWL